MCLYSICHQEGDNDIMYVVFIQYIPPGRSDICRLYVLCVYTVFTTACRGTWTQGTYIMVYFYMCYVFIQLTEHMQFIPQPVGGTWTEGAGRVRGVDTVTITCTFPAGIQNVSASFRFHISF